MNILNHYILLLSILKYANRFELVENKQEAIKLVKNWQIKSEIIGQWLYCYTTDLIGIQLLSMGFWYSKKHNAFIYSGTEKDGFAGGESLEELRIRHGHRQINGNKISVNM